METSVKIRYAGPALDDGRMDVYQAASNMLAFSEFMVVAVKATFGDDVETKAEVSGFDRGSFETDLLISFVGPATTIFATSDSALSVKVLWESVRGAFRLWKHLKGSPPVQVESDGVGSMAITNVNNSTINVKNEVSNIVFNVKASDAVGKFVREGLGHAGYEAIHITSEGSKEPRVTVSAREAGYFVPVAPETILSENTIRMTLILISAVFQEGSKWRFSDGTAAFNADIADENFLAAVDAGERFGKGDVLDVDLLIVQTGSPGRLATSRTIAKVHKHPPPRLQYGLELDR